MTTPDSLSSEHGPAYTLDIIASACGISSQTVVHYHEQGLLSPVSLDENGTALYDDDCLHRLRRIEHLRETYALETSALRLTLDLMDEVERLRSELRHRR